MEARIEKLMDLVFELKQDVAALKEKSSSGTDPEPEPTTKTWTVTVTQSVTDQQEVKYKLTGSSDDVTIESSNVTLIGSPGSYTGFSFTIESATQPDIASMTYGGSAVEKSNIAVAEKLDN